MRRKSLTPPGVALVPVRHPDEDAPRSWLGRSFEYTARFPVEMPDGSEMEYAVRVEYEHLGWRLWEVTPPVANKALEAELFARATVEASEVML